MKCKKKECTCTKSMAEFCKFKPTRQTPRKKKPKVRSRTLSDLKKECWYWLSLYVRLYWSDERGYVICATTQQKRYFFKSGVDCGHFVPKSQAGCTAFMFDNLLPQSKGSNMSASGDQYLMGKAIDTLNKKGLLQYSADELISMNKQQAHKMNKAYIEEKITEYKEQVFLLSDSKKLWDWKDGCLKKYLNSSYFTWHN